MRELVRIEDVTVKKETAKAILVVIEGQEHWIAKSQIDDESEVYKADSFGTLVVPLWLAEEKGFA